MWEYAASVLRIVDGDTFWARVDLGFRLSLDVDIRLAGINAPEVVNYGASGIVDPARDYIARAIPPGSVCVLRVSKAEKYARWLADVLYLPGESDRVKIAQNGAHLNGELIRLGLARPYKR